MGQLCNEEWIALFITVKLKKQIKYPFIWNQLNKPFIGD